MDRVDRLLVESAVLPETAVDKELRLVRKAVLIEDSLGITLSEAAIMADLLSQPAALTALLDKSHGG